MSLESLHRQLTDIARKRVQAGELTERRLARLCGLSQPHLHNVLKGIRSLSTDSADRLLGALKMSVAELIWQGSGPDTGVLRAVPLLRNRIGPGTIASFSDYNGFAPFPLALTGPLVDPVAARIAPDLVLPGCIAAHDLALLDQNPILRERPTPGACWVVTAGGGLRIRYVRVKGSRIAITNEANASDSPAWRSFPPGESGILEIVKARVVWIGREFTIAPGSG